MVRFGMAGQWMYNLISADGELNAAWLVVGINPTITIQFLIYEHRGWRTQAPKQ